ncbi:MAG: DUF3488 and transglutaminase-like domain-containing protein [Bifidobacteriaceae bacterium]|jgi:transglutaminase-like putative cysteine protease|nr:DUF3488 and transglutaminase-like domain-containing protein [Bifidobacteriaceae bacterium]
MSRVRPGVLAATLLLYLSLAVPIAPLIMGSDWIGWYVGFGLMVFTVGLIGRSAGLANGLIGLIQAALVPPALTAAFAADVAWFWIIPNARAWDRFTDLASDLGRAFLLEASPLVAGQWIFAFVALSGALLAWVFDWYVFTVKAPAATGLFAALVGVVAVAFVRQGLPPVTFAPMAVAYLVLLAATARGARPRLAAPALVVGAVALGLAAGQITPGLGIGGLVQGRDRAKVHVGGDNPLLDLGDDLRSSPSTEAMRYNSQVGPVYLRLTTLSQFDGTTWSHLPGEQRPLEADSEGAAWLSEPGRGQVGVEAAVGIEIADLNSDWLPLPYQPLSVTGVDGALRVDEADLTVGFVRGGTDDQSYQVSAWLPDPGSDEARALAGGGLTGAEVDALEPYIWLPNDLPEVIGQTAREAVALSGNDPFEQALALEDFFRQSDFSYSMSTPAREGYDGDSGAVVARFLEVKAGYCVHFAAAMTLMARSLGIPARVAIGYLPGNPIARDGSITQYSVAADRLHAWPELHIPGSGWVGFEPTVSRADASSYLSASPTPSLDDDVPPPSARPSPSGRSTSPSARPSPSASPSGPAGPSSSDPDVSWSGPSWPIWSASVFCLLALVAAVPGLWRRWLRRRRLRGGLVEVWAEILATANDLGLSSPPWRTPAAVAGELAAWLDSSGQGAAARALEGLAADLQRAAYAPPDGSSPPGAGRAGGAAARTVLRGLARSQPRQARLVAWWSPRSLRLGSGARKLAV